MAPVRYVYTADEVGAMIGQTRQAICKRVKRHGHVLGVAPVPDTGRRIVFSSAAIDRVLGIER